MKLLEGCTEEMTGATATGRIRGGLMPSGVKQWPDERLTVLLAAEDIGSVAS